MPENFRTLSEISHYVQLAEHHFRVAGAADVILENIDLSPPAVAFGSSRWRAGLNPSPNPGEGNIDRQAIITACLLHDIDMGNILKFDLSTELDLTLGV